MASELQKFATSAFAASRTTIGGENLTIGGGVAVSAVLSEDTIEDEYDSVGFLPSSSFTAVVDSSEFATAYPLAVSTYKGKSVSARGKLFRLKQITSGASFVTLRLETITKA